MDDKTLLSYTRKEVHHNEFARKQKFANINLWGQRAIQLLPVVVCHPVLKGTPNQSIVRGFPDTALDRWTIGHFGLQTRSGGILSWQYFAFIQLNWKVILGWGKMRNKSIQTEQKKKLNVFFCFFFKTALTLDIDKDWLWHVLRTCADVHSTVALFNWSDEQVGPCVASMSIIFDAHLTWGQHIVLFALLLCMQI